MRAALAALAASTLLATSAVAGFTPAQSKVMDKAFRIIREHHLVEKDYMQCFSLMFEDEDVSKIAKIEARESHKPYPKRGNADPGTAPRLFNLEIDMKTGKAKWNRLDAENTD